MKVDLQEEEEEAVEVVEDSGMDLSTMAIGTGVYLIKSYGVYKRISRALILANEQRNKVLHKCNKY